MTTTTQAPRIDQLDRGAIVVLECGAGKRAYDERALFVGIIGEHDDRRARFVSVSEGGGNHNRLRDDAKGYYEWEAYRYNGRWAFGTGAERIAVMEVL